MSSVNVQVSVSNLVQMDKPQNEIHKNPVVNQEQNAQIARHEAAKRVNMPVEPDKTEGKKINAENKQPDPRQKGKKRKREKENPQRPDLLNRKDSGYFVDIEV